MNTAFYIGACVAAGIAALPAFWYVMRYNLHMFQLNGYKNGEHIVWIKKNNKKQAVLFLAGITGIVDVILNNAFSKICILIACLIIIRYYLYLKKSNVKKKLVFTKRVQRQVLTNIILVAIVLAATGIVAVTGKLAATGIVAGVGYLTAASAFIIAVQAVVLLFVNIINRPVENAVGKYFINDAKKKLSQVKGITVIGVTGSYGKTSVKYYLQTLLQEKFNVLITPESYNTPMGVVKTIRESLSPTHEIFICEMGARHVGDIKEICDIVHPQHGMITSVGPQHLETFFNIDNVRKTKFELADALPSDGMLFLNGDNSYIQEHGENYSNRIFYRSESDGEGYQVSDVKLSQLGTEFVVTAPDGAEESFQMRLIGGHNIINVVGAISVAHELGISLKDLKVPVRRLQPVAHRMQMLEKGAVTIIDDAYNSNPVGSKAAVETLAMFDGIKILITPGMVELGKEEEEYNYKFGTYAAKCCDYILLVGRKHAEPIMKGAIDAGFPKEKCILYDGLNEALSYAYSIKGSEHKYILLENDLPDNY